MIEPQKLARGNVTHTPLAKGNEALRQGHYALAITHYAQVLSKQPVLAKSILANLSLARHKYRASRNANEITRVAVCGWDLAHNTAGRVTTFANIYDTFAKVQIIGSLFSSGGRAIWEPIRDTKIPKHTITVDDDSTFLIKAIQLIAAHPYDIVHLSTPRAPNIFFGVLYKLLWDAKVLIDIDEEEHALAGKATPISIQEFIEQHGTLPQIRNLAGIEWTRLSFGLAKEFDGITVCNAELQERHGGVIIRHAADQMLLKKLTDNLLDNFSSNKERRDFSHNKPLVKLSETFISGITNFYKPTKEIAQDQEKITPARNDPKSNIDNQYIAKAKLPITVLVITWDVGHNPLGRSYMIAEVIERIVRHSLLVGFQFPRYGNDIWEPLRQASLPIIALPGSNLPDFFESIQKISVRFRPDIVIACKPRLPSVALAMMIREKWGCPMIVDVDDHELSFFNDQTELTLDELSAMPIGAAANDVEPYSNLWTRLTQSLCRSADEIIVSNTALKQKFGGTIIPHVRDEKKFDPTRFDKFEVRKRHGIPEEFKIILFFGTPRTHKGVDTLARAVNQISNPQYKLLIVGTAPDRSVTNHLNKIAPNKIIFLPNQPFEAIPEILAMADVVCLPQDEASAISKYQLPAKAIDAVAMGIPLLVSNTPPLKQLIEDKIAQVISNEKIPEVIQDCCINGESSKAMRHLIRATFIKKYSYGAAAGNLREAFDRCLKSKTVKINPPLNKLIDASYRALGLKHHRDIQSNCQGVDVVLFWKQNDTGIYGRRHDMVINYLASRNDIRMVLVFDAPISEFDLIKKQRSLTKENQDRWIYVESFKKVFGAKDTTKVSYNVFLYPPGIYRNKDSDHTKPNLSEGYIPFVSQVFQREYVDSKKAIFWFYPKNYLAPALANHFTPAKIVVDVVDDHRAWPGISDEERLKLTANYRETIALADMVFANCAEVVQSMSEFCSDIRLVPNGCDDQPIKYNLLSQRAVDDCAARRKCILFAGNLEKKIDIALLEKVALRFSECDIVLIGSTHANPDILSLKRYKNINFVGVVPYSDIGKWLSDADVGIIPHLNISLTKNMNPLKLYVYLSWGVPVVSTEVYNIDTVSGFVKVARSHDEFLHFVEITLNCSRPDPNLIKSYVSANSWSARFSPHIDILLYGQCSAGTGATHRGGGVKLPSVAPCLAPRVAPTPEDPEPKDRRGI